jgi:DNA repair protein RadC
MKVDMDRMRFIELLSKYTKISKSEIENFLKTGTVNDIFQNPGLITNNLSKVKRIEELKLLRNTYDNLKNYERNYTISSPKAAADFFINQNMDIQDKEYFSVAFLNTKNQVLDVSVTAGSIDSAYVYKREIIKEAFKYNASSILISHNHPTGNPSPSPQDLDLTGNIYNACKTVGINLLDHIITANTKHYSIKEHHDLNELGRGSFVYEEKENYVDERPSIINKLNKAKKEIKTMKRNNALEKSAGASVEL